ncbi:GGDEF domain-containing protein [Desulfonatronum lacustre]|uniref:GGDEF domain-containing protein n=1 Tax=Desulfonatronum lacustre TaxID=66849 RepID=UPI001B7FDC19|nr:GGDEF domain-containing protein [Desulfonatronum lacustre]
MDTMSEFRALRASVVSQWIKANPTVTGQQLEDLTRFHEAIDQALVESMEHYTVLKEMDTRLFGTILVASPDPICVLDLEGRFSYANRATADLFALNPKAIIGHSTSDLGFSFASDLQSNLEKVIANQSIYRGNFSHTFGTGKGERFAYLLAPVLDEHQHTEAIVCIFRDITEQALAEEKIWHSANHDPLTGLPNRRLFLDRLEQGVTHAKRSSLPLAVLFLDLDGFKKVNDSLGHEVGDHLLSDVAKRITDCIREEDTVARMGGDEFTVILTGAKERNGVERVAKDIIDALEKPFLIAQQPVQISVSIGISFYPHDASSPHALLEAADQAMYNAKKSGSNRMWFYDTSATRPIAIPRLNVEEPKALRKTADCKKTESRRRRRTLSRIQLPW